MSEVIDTDKAISAIAEYILQLEVIIATVDLTTRWEDDDEDRWQKAQDLLEWIDETRKPVQDYLGALTSR